MLNNKILDTLLIINKRSTQMIDITGALKDAIANEYNTNPNEYSNEINSINNKRIEIENNSVETYFVYYKQLELIEKRFKTLSVEFIWNDSIHSKQYKQQSLAFEKSSVLFNLGALLNNTKLDSNVYFNYLQISSFVFAFLAEHFLFSPSVDLSKEHLLFLSKLTASQAQEVFLYSAISSNKTCNLLSKLCYGCYSLYNDTLSLLSNASVSESVESVVTAKLHLYQSLAQYYKSIADKQNMLYGMSIARQQQSLQSLSQASQCLNVTGSILSVFGKNDVNANNVNVLQEIIKSTSVVIESEMKQSTKDNDLIYLNPIPSLANNEELGSTIVAKPMDFNQLLSNFKIVDYFKDKIIPIEVTEFDSVFCEEKRKYFSQLEDIFSVISEHAALTESYELGRLIASSTNPKQSILALLDKVELQNYNLIDIHSFTQFQTSANSLLNSIQTKLSTLNQPSDALHEHKQILEKATRNDGKVMKEFNAIIPTNSLQQQCRLEIQNLVDSSFSTKSVDKQMLYKLTNADEQQKQLYSQAKELLADVKSKIFNEQISDILVTADHNAQAVFDAILNKYSAFKSRLLDLQQQTRTLFDIITNTRNSLLMQSNFMSTLDEAKRIISNYERKSNVFKESSVVVNENIKVATEFYKGEVEDLKQLLYQLEEKSKQERQQMDMMEKQILYGGNAKYSQPSPSYPPSFPSQSNYMSPSSTIPPSLPVTSDYPSNPHPYAQNPYYTAPPYSQPPQHTPPHFPPASNFAYPTNQYAYPSAYSMNANQAPQYPQNTQLVYPQNTQPVYAHTPQTLPNPYQPHYPQPPSNAVPSQPQVPPKPKNLMD